MTVRDVVSQLKSTSVRFGFCVSNPSDSGADLSLDHSLFNYMENKSHTTLVFMLVLLIITYYIHSVHCHIILYKSKH